MSLGQVAGDLDDIADGATYFKTNSDEKAGAGRAANALDSAGDYIRSLRSTKIVVSAPNPTTGWVGDGAGIRLYQSGSLKVNIPVSGDPSFSGNITGGGDIDITGVARFNGNTSDAGSITAILANNSKNQASGIRAYAGSSGGNGVYGNANNSSGTGYGGFFRRQIGTSGAALNAVSSTTAPAATFSNDGGSNSNSVTLITSTAALQTSGNADIGGTLQCNSLRIDQTPTTGAGTANFNANNKPGGTTTNTWISISCNGNTRYIPVWG